MTAGKGGFDLGSKECVRPGFYCIATKTPKPTLYTQEQFELGYPFWQAKTTPIDIKPPSMATIKSNNYLPNALCADDAEADTHATHGIFVDPDGYVSEGGNFNVAFITYNDELVVPEFDNNLPGTTIKRIMDLVPQVPSPTQAFTSPQNVLMSASKTWSNSLARESDRDQLNICTEFCPVWLSIVLFARMVRIFRNLSPADFAQPSLFP